MGSAMKPTRSTLVGSTAQAPTGGRSGPAGPTARYGHGRNATDAPPSATPTTGASAGEPMLTPLSPHPRSPLPPPPTSLHTPTHTSTSTPTTTFVSTRTTSTPTHTTVRSRGVSTHSRVPPAALVVVTAVG